jgi:hypothetical protein
MRVTRLWIALALIAPAVAEERYGLPFVGPSRPAAPDSAPLTVGEKAKYYLRAYEPQDFVRSAFWAGIAHAGNSPEEWGGGIHGYNRRFASRFATHAVRRSIQFGIGAVRKEDPRFLSSGKTGFWARTGYVLSRTVLVRHDDGHDTVAAGRLVGAFGAGLISNTWQPSTRNSVGDGLVRGATTLAGDAVMRMCAEFWPDIKRIFRREPKPDALRR